MISQIIIMVYFYHYPLKFKGTTMYLIELNAQKGLRKKLHNPIGYCGPKNRPKSYEMFSETRGSSHE